MKLKVANIAQNKFTLRIKKNNNNKQNKNIDAKFLYDILLNK